LLDTNIAIHLRDGHETITVKVTDDFRDIPGLPLLEW
jgi:hypothetical protein